MRTREIVLSLAGFAIIGWLLRAAAQIPAPMVATPASRSNTIPAILTNVITAPSSTLTNLPGIGLVPTAPVELEDFKAKVRRELSEQLRTRGVFSNRRDQIQAQDNGELAWIYIDQRKNLKLAMTHILDAVVEPYPQRTLEALEHILKNASDPQLQKTAAMLLYRYDQPSGKRHLLALLNSLDSDLAARHVMLGFAMNREPESIPGIVADLARRERPSTVTLAALGRWHVPEIDDLLKKKARFNPEDWGYALALVQGGETAASGALERRLAKELRPVGDVVFELEAALARIGRLDPTVWQRHLARINHTQ